MGRRHTLILPVLSRNAVLPGSPCLQRVSFFFVLRRTTRPSCQSRNLGGTPENLSASLVINSAAVTDLGAAAPGDLDLGHRFERDGGGRAGDHAFAALDAVGFAHVCAEVEGDPRAGAFAVAADDVVLLHLVAGAGTQQSHEDAGNSAMVIPE